MRANPNRIAVELRGDGAQHPRTQCHGADPKPPRRPGPRHLSPCTRLPLKQRGRCVLFGLGEDDKVEELTVHWPPRRDPNPARPRRSVSAMSSSRTRPPAHPQRRSTAPPLSPSHDGSPRLNHRDAGWENDFTPPRPIAAAVGILPVGPGARLRRCRWRRRHRLLPRWLGGRTRARSASTRATGRFTAVMAAASPTTRPARTRVRCSSMRMAMATPISSSPAAAMSSSPALLDNRDRLYLNDGKGTFTAAPDGALPGQPDRIRGVAPRTLIMMATSICSSAPA